MYHGYNTATVKLKELFNWTYSISAYERLCDVIAQLIIKAGNLRDEGQGGNSYMIRRVMSTVDEHIGESWQEYKARCSAPEHVYVLSCTSWHKAVEDFVDWNWVFFTEPTDEVIAQKMIGVKYELPVDRVDVATLSYIKDGEDIDDARVIRKVRFVYLDDSNDHHHFLPYKYIGEDECFPETPFWVQEGAKGCGY